MKRTLVAMLVSIAFLCGQLAAQEQFEAGQWLMDGEEQHVSTIDEVNGDTIEVSSVEGGPSGRYEWDDSAGLYRKEGGGDTLWYDGENWGGSGPGGDGGVVILPG